MKKILFFLSIAFVCNATAQNVISNPNLNNGYQRWNDNDNLENGCHPTIGGLYPYSIGSAYWFEDSYGGPTNTNIVSEVNACMHQRLCLIKGLTYRFSFKAQRRCEAWNPDLPPTLSLEAIVRGATTFTSYIDNVYTYSNTSWNWSNETMTFAVPLNAVDDSFVVAFTSYNQISEFGAILDDITLVPEPSLTVNGPVAAAVNTATSWNVSNIPASGVTYSWSFPGATPSTSTAANPTNIQWATQGSKTVSCTLNNGSGNVVTITQIINITAPLPISLFAFNAAAKNNTVDLTWTTSNEINNDYFILYRSKNGVNFDEVAKVNAAGISAGSTYAFNDANAGTGVTYYKLKQVDKNGVYRYSGVIKASIGVKDLDVHVYPTVVNDVLNYVVDNPKVAKLNIIISDMNGKRISAGSANFATGSTQKNVNVSNLSAGVYLLTVIDENYSFKKSVLFTKQ
jgi:hypothetical protein